MTRAREFAQKAHRQKDHRRKYSGEPYEVHLIAVAAIVASVTQDERTIAAAYLHDVVEDTDVTLDEVEAAFGPDVAELVENLTDISRPSDGNRAQRKALDREHLARARPEAMTVKLADIIHNARDIAQHDRGFGRVYIREAEALLKVLKDGDPVLYQRAHETLREALALCEDS
ncbi:MAG TPA: HD domain-containing protein [Oligoflexus sp.]|uniref:HD domain-containing protein n=1 Tax=Oligoflexus sp. TaxID=1971216 RepID=UPI002D7F7E41|nr:HD domain-containing protein [Oligoflexus sp.]HET9240038.1 HD domain-containing protein [Oligoflexus sp.]